LRNIQVNYVKMSTAVVCEFLQIQREAVTFHGNNVYIDVVVLVVLGILSYAIGYILTVLTIQRDCP
jgi:hypothetical protein